MMNPISEVQVSEFGRVGHENLCLLNGVLTTGPSYSKATEKVALDHFENHLEAFSQLPQARHILHWIWQVDKKEKSRVDKLGYYLSAKEQAAELLENATSRTALEIDHTLKQAADTVAKEQAEFQKAFGKYLEEQRKKEIAVARLDFAKNKDKPCMLWKEPCDTIIFCSDGKVVTSRRCELSEIAYFEKYYTFQGKPPETVTVGKHTYTYSMTLDRFSERVIKAYLKNEDIIDDEALTMEMCAFAAMIGDSHFYNATSELLLDTVTPASAIEYAVKLIPVKGLDQYFNRNFSEISKAPFFETIPASTIHTILDATVIGVQNETELFDVLQRWVKGQAKMRRCTPWTIWTELGDRPPLINRLRMDLISLDRVQALRQEERLSEETADEYFNVKSKEPSRLYGKLDEEESSFSIHWAIPDAKEQLKLGVALCSQSFHFEKLEISLWVGSYVDKNRIKGAGFRHKIIESITNYTFTYKTELSNITDSRTTKIFSRNNGGVFSGYGPEFRQEKVKIPDNDIVTLSVTVKIQKE